MIKTNKEKTQRYLFEGANYSKVEDLPLKEIAKIIRTELKQFKDCKFSVTCQNYSGGSSLSIGIKPDFKVFSDTYELFRSTVTDLLFIDWLRENYLEPYNIQEQMYTLRASEVLKKVKKIVESYNYDDSDSMTDYFNCGFYLHIDFLEGEYINQ